MYRWGAGNGVVRVRGRCTVMVGVRIVVEMEERIGFMVGVAMGIGVGVGQWVSVSVMVEVRVTLMCKR